MWRLRNYVRALRGWLNRNFAITKSRASPFGRISALALARMPLTLACLLFLVVTPTNRMPNCDDGKSEGWEAANKAFTEQGCNINSRIKKCPNGAWYTEYYSEPPCNPPSKPQLKKPPEDIPLDNPGAGAWSNCSDAQQRKIIKAFKLARVWVIKSDERLQAYIEHAGAPQSRISTALKTHFRLTGGTTDLQDGVSPDTVLQNIRQLEANLGATVTGACADADVESPNSKLGVGDKRVGIASAPDDNTNHFNYAPSFFKRDPGSQAVTVIHEMAHSWLHFGDTSYEDQKDYPGRPGVATQNPASYGGFIRDAGRAH